MASRNVEAASMGSDMLAREPGLVKGGRTPIATSGAPSASLHLPRRPWQHLAMSDAPASMAILWISAGPGCDGDTIAMTSATPPRTVYATCCDGEHRTLARHRDGAA